jgi:hypothetical protein
VKVFVIEAIRNTVSRAIGSLEPMSATPMPEYQSSEPSRTTPAATPADGQRFRISASFAA